MNTRVILEMCYNHNGDFKLAKKMIKKAAELKAWAVKFQKWDIQGMPENIRTMKREPENSYGSTYEEHRENLEFDIGQLLKLKELAESLDIVFMCSGKDYKSIVELVEAGIKYIKLPSQRLFDNQIFRYLTARKAAQGLKIFVSAGMIEEKELKLTNWPKHADGFFHCISLYPAELNDCNMSVILRNKIFNGYSSHEKGAAAVPIAVAMGCQYIERHFTLDKEMKGADHKIGSDPKEIEELINILEVVEAICGGSRVISEKEKEIKQFYQSF